MTSLKAISESNAYIQATKILKNAKKEIEQIEKTNIEAQTYLPSNNNLKREKVITAVAGAALLGLGIALASTLAAPIAIGIGSTVAGLSALYIGRQMRQLYVQSKLDLGKAGQTMQGDENKKAQTNISKVVKQTADQLNNIGRSVTTTAWKVTGTLASIIAGLAYAAVKFDAADKATQFIASTFAPKPTTFLQKIWG
jgi:predicted secreted protein